jgi:hypothetical protein
MKVFSESIVLFTATFLIASSFASPATPITIINQNVTFLDNINATITDLRNDFQCFEPHLAKDRRAKTMDCIRAAAKLPNLHEVATFHKGSNQDDPYAVPYSESFGTCRVTIDLRFGRPDESSWLVINMVMRFKVIDACSLRLGGERTGGQTTAGSGGRITITAENVKWPQSIFASA